MKGWTYKDLQNIMTEAELDQFAKSGRGIQQK